jgi:hypothetical protein
VFRRIGLVVLVAGLLIGGPAQAAHAYTITSWNAGVYSDDYSGPSDTHYYTQAGGHPYEGVTDFTVSGGVTKSVRVDLPPGLMSNPQATPQCTNAQFPNCPQDTQLGVVKLTASLLGIKTYIGASVYNVVPPSGKVSDFAFQTIAGRTDILGGIRSTTDDGLYFTIAVPSTATLVSSTLIFWGVPGDSAHNPDRAWSCLSVLSACSPPASSTTHKLSGKPFITLPSGCVPAGQLTTLSLTSYAGQSAQAESKTPVPGTGCSKVPFNPSLAVKPQTTQSDTPTGVAIDLRVPQNEDPGGLASSTLQNATVTLPPGMTLDPSAANGLKACTPAEFGKGSDAAPTCPSASQIGTVEIDTPLLAAPLTGQVYLGCDGGSSATPCPAKNGLAYLYLYATGQGVTQKLEGTVTANKSTGRVTNTFVEEPQVPFSDLKLTIKGGPAAPLANPLRCGTATTASSLKPWSGNPAAEPGSSFKVDYNGAGGACPSPLPFSPALALTPHTTQGGAYDSPLSVTITRPQQQQFLSGITTGLPRGLLAVIKGVPRCPAKQAASGNCPASSQIGTTTVLAGSGPAPLSQPGTVYLTGPYEGAPLGLSIVVPAIAGPFDLGRVVVRARIKVDKHNAHLTIISDPLPQIVGGIPLRVRAVTVTIDRSRFVVNPTNCAALEASGTFTSAQRSTAKARSPFQASGCASLPFQPKLQMSLTGKGRTKPGDHPNLIATVTSPGLGQANLSKARVTLPLSLALDPKNSEHVCSVKASRTDTCPPSAIVGQATVSTPLLSAPLSGPVYLVKGVKIVHGHRFPTLPTLLVTLRGQIAIDLRAQTQVNKHSQLVTIFHSVPDAAISSFRLEITGGRKGILVVTGYKSLCVRPQIATEMFTAQSGASQSGSVTMSTPCGK